MKISFDWLRYMLHRFKYYFNNRSEFSSSHNLTQSLGHNIENLQKRVEAFFSADTIGESDNFPYLKTDIGNLFVQHSEAPLHFHSKSFLINATFSTFRRAISNTPWCDDGSWRETLQDYRYFIVDMKLHRFTIQRFPRF